MVESEQRDEGEIKRDRMTLSLPTVSHKRNSNLKPIRCSRQQSKGSRPIRFFRSG